MNPSRLLMPRPTTGDRLRRIVTLSAVLVLLASCASTSPGYDSRFGDAARQLRAQQMIDPSAPTRNQGVTSATDGRVVQEGSERYVESFRAPPTPTVVNIGVGSSGR